MLECNTNLSLNYNSGRTIRSRASIDGTHICQRTSLLLKVHLRQNLSYDIYAHLLVAAVEVLSAEREDVALDDATRVVAVALAIVQLDLKRQAEMLLTRSRSAILPRELVLRRQKLRRQTRLPLVPCKSLQRVRDLLAVGIIVESLITAPFGSIRESWVVFVDIRVGVDRLAKVAVIAEDVAFSFNEAVGGRASLLDAWRYFVLGAASDAANRGRRNE
jgi:hypothetical protein